MTERSMYETVVLRIRELDPLPPSAFGVKILVTEDVPTGNGTATERWFTVSVQLPGWAADNLRAKRRQP